MIGIDVGEAETEAFWREFLRGLLARGLDGVLLCVSDAHEGLKKAIAQVLGCPWQRCTVHFLRDMLGHVHEASSRSSRPRSARSSPPRRSLRRARAWPAWSPASRPRRPRWPCSSRPPRRSCSPSWPSRASTGRSCARPTRWSASTRRSRGAATWSASTRTTRASIRLAGALLLEQNDEWLVGRRYLSAESLAGLYAAEQTREPERPAPKQREVVLLTTTTTRRGT